MRKEQSKGTESTAREKDVDNLVDQGKKRDLLLTIK